MMIDSIVKEAPITMKQAQELLLGLSPKTIANHVKEGRLRGYKLGARRWVFYQSEIMEDVHKLTRKQKS